MINKDLSRQSDNLHLAAHDAANLREADANDPVERMDNRDPSRPEGDEYSASAPKAGPKVRPMGDVQRQEVTVRATREPHAEDFGGGTLLAPDECHEMRDRWTDIQSGFVDDPKLAVRNADELVGEAIGRLSEIFQKTRHDLEEEWDREESISTEQLRLALKRYRTFFDQILAT